MFYHYLRPSLGKNNLYVFANMLISVKNPKHIDYAKNFIRNKVEQGKREGSENNQYFLRQDIVV